MAYQDRSGCFSAPRLGFLTLALTVLLSCAARRPGPNEPISGEAWIRKVSIKGAKSLDADDIKEGLASRPPHGLIIVHKTRLDASLIERDQARIHVYYQKRGFFDAKVTAVEIKKISKLESDVIFHVEEGERSEVINISTRGLPAEVSQAPDFDLGVDTGDAFDHDEFIVGQTAILTATLERGYAHAKVSGRAKVERKIHAVALRYDVVPGPKVYFGNIEIRGLRTIPESAVRNRLMLKTGQLFHPKKITQSQSQIRSLGRFGIVRLDFQDDENSRTGDLVVTVTEAPRQEIRAGLGVGIDQNNFQARARAEYTFHGVIDPLLSFTIQGRPAYAVLRTDTSQRELIWDLSTSLTREDLFAPLAQGKATLGFDIDVLEPYSSQGGDLALKFSQPLAEQRVRLGLGWRLELLDFTRIEAAIGDELRDSLGFQTAYRSAFFDQRFVLDFRDSLLNASKGWYAEITMEEGGSFAGGAFSYGRVTPELRAYHAFSERFTMAAKASAGRTLWGSLPITRRFFSGGATRHRGFSQRRLSPTASANGASAIAVGGDKLVELNLESRLNLTKVWDEWLGVTVFADGGDVVFKSDTIAMDNLHWAMGMGLRYLTIVGPIRFDVGYRINRTGADEIQPGDRLAFHLLIGEAF
ncbi:MAG: BamA/TamA family outer membrane protein [Kofleriaceae bacterium]|nr:BamA/TamA family outer membrane protein [Kofleriaceae bacterium]